LIFVICLLLARTARPGQVATNKPLAETSNSLGGDESDDCVDCHRKEVDGFARSKMARSMRLPDQEPAGTVEIGSANIRIYSNREGTWQSLDSHGLQSKYQVAYVVGSGTHANGYLISLGNHLFQSPVAYYRHRSAYGLAPGYENKQDPDFTRPVEPGCLFCHAGAFTAIPGTLNQYAAKPFSHLAITCSRCHGPVADHLDHPGRSTIVNPARLEPSARDSICEQCHLKGVARILNPGKNFSDFIPGQPLENTFTTYRFLMPEGSDPPFKVISHSEQLALSACKRASGNKLWCGTCHDPHNEPVDPVSYFRGRCLSCHAGTSFAPSHPSKGSDCISCHMPKKETNDGGHTVFTDHRIQRRSFEKAGAEPTGIVPWREPPPGLEKRNLGIANVQAGMERGSWSQIVSGYRTLTEVQNQFPQDSELYRSIGNALFLGRQLGEASIAFELAVRYNSSSSPNEASLGAVYAAMGRNDSAEMHLERALNIDPLNIEAAEALINIYEKGGQSTKADALKNRIGSYLH
jgi:hypothetical protein